MKKVIILLVMLSVFVIAEQGLAEAYMAYKDGQKLKTEAYAYERTHRGMGSSDDGLDGMLFIGYVSGVTDALSMGGGICLPEDAKLEQIFFMVIKYIKNNPEKWHLSGVQIVYDALEPTFPCKKD